MMPRRIFDSHGFCRPVSELSYLFPPFLFRTQRVNLFGESFIDFRKVPLEVKARANSVWSLTEIGSSTEVLACARKTTSARTLGSLTVGPSRTWTFTSRAAFFSSAIAAFNASTRVSTRASAAASPTGSVRQSRTRTSLDDFKVSYNCAESTLSPNACGRSRTTVFSLSASGEFDCTTFSDIVVAPAPLH
jgi:hypothetical protein